MRLDRITLREIRLPLKEPFRISSGVVHERRILLLELLDVSGARVWSECVAGETPNYSPETIDTAWIAIEHWVAPRILGHEFDHPGAGKTCQARRFVKTVPWFTSAQGSNMVQSGCHSFPGGLP